MATRTQYRNENLPLTSHMIPFPAPHVPGIGQQPDEPNTTTYEIFRQVDRVSLFESAPDAMVLVNRGGRIVAANSKAEKMFGYRREELVGEPIEKLIPQQLQKSYVAHYSQYNAATDARPARPGLELFGRHQDDHQFPVEISVSEVKTQGGVLVSNAIRDVTEHNLSRSWVESELSKASQEIAELKQRLEKENIYLREEVRLARNQSAVVGNSDGIRRVLQEVEQVAPTDSTVLVLGETGTGKELIARTIHEHSRRNGRVMVKVNCAALPATLIESELFGREKGAFTGALTREMGRFELANGSTILLDEVGELPIELQSKLLRVLQEGEFERLGSSKTIKVDVRVIAATSRNLQQAVREGKFREDLFYRLNVFPITVPPLRERQEDIPPLVWHFLGILCQRMGRSIETVHVATMNDFKSYSWPGNVRELCNVIERFLITSTGTVFRAKLPQAETAEVAVRPQTLEEVERNYLLRVMEMVGWRVRGEGGAAQTLGLKPTTLESRLQKLGLSRPK